MTTEEWRAQLERTLASATSVRHRARPLLQRTLASRATDAELVLGELTSNAIEHGAGHVAVSIRVDARTVVISVCDEGRSDGLAMVSGEGHYGLDIVRALADGVSVESSSGTEVHATFVRR